MKRVISVLILAGILMTFPVCASATGDSDLFDDVPSDHWASAEISRAVTRGFMEGISDDAFESDSPVTVAEIMVMVTRQFGDISSVTEEDAAEWRDAYLKTCAEAGETLKMTDAWYLREYAAWSRDLLAYNGQFEMNWYDM